MKSGVDQRFYGVGLDQTVHRTGEVQIAVLLGQPSKDVQAAITPLILVGDRLS